MKKSTQKKRSVANRKHRNPWKIAFTVLLAMIIASVAFVAVEVYTPSTKVQQEAKVQPATNQLTSIDVKMDKKQLSSVLNYYLNHQQKNSNNIKYKFILNQSAILIGTTKVLGERVSFTLYAVPTLNKDGNILLKIKSVAIGSLNAPKQFILTYVKNHFKTGRAVQISPKKSEITLNLNRVKTKQGIRVKGQSLDLKNDDIRFRVLIPLGEEEK